VCRGAGPLPGRPTAKHARAPRPDPDRRQDIIRRQRCLEGRDPKFELGAVGDARVDERDALTDTGHTHIVGWVKALNRWRFANHVRPAPASSPKTSFGTVCGKVGRNEHCPCGSGKNYKRCHGAD